MTYAEFERRAREEWERIPEQYRAGVDGLVIERSATPHPSLPDVYTLGECLTESYPSDFGGPDTTRSVVVLYYGSFFRLSRLDEEFDWDTEIWETLTHELQHHLESLATEDALVDLDYAADENFKRGVGEPFDPFFYRHGTAEDGWYRIEDEAFLETAPPAPRVPVHFDWHGVGYRVQLPDELGDVTFLTVTDGVADPPRALHLVVVSRTGWREAVGRLFGRRRPRIVEYDVTAQPD